MSRSKIFISYRRSDAGGHAGRLYDRLRHWFDADALFYDLAGIDMGEVFPAEIEAALDSASVVLVLIAADWLAEINRRAGEPGVDFVRREVELALTRQGQGALLLPVLLGGAAMPSAQQFHADLQAALAPLCHLDAHAFQGKQADWDNQFVALRTRIAAVPDIPAPRFQAPAGAERPNRVIEHLLSPHFRDPNELLARLRGQLAESGSAALFGMGGLGKTQLALKYSQDYRDLYAGVWWFRAESETTLQLDAQDCCTVVGAPVQRGEAPSTALKRWLAQQTSPWLLVFDNADNVAQLRPHLPLGGPHHLIITSRNPAWGGVAQALELSFWSAEQGATFLAERLPAAAAADLPRLSADLGGLPLALEQAASYIEQTGIAVADYRALLAKVDTEGLILDEGRAATGYERSVLATLSLAFARLSPAAAQLLRLLAFAAAEPLPERFFHEAAQELPAELAEATTNPLLWNRIIGELRAYGLTKRPAIPVLDRAPGEMTERTEPALTVHRLTQQTTRAQLAQPAEDCRRLLGVLCQCCPRDPNLPDHWPRYAALAPHATHLDRYFAAAWLDHESFSWLLDQVANYLHHGPAIYTEAAHWFHRGWDIHREQLGDEDPESLTAMSNFALSLQDQGDLAGARQLQESALAIRRRVLGKNHPDTLTAMSNLAITLQAQGDLASAHALQKSALAARRHVLGEEHNDTLTSMNNLAVIAQMQGDLAGAQRLQESALAARRRGLGEEHPETLALMSNLASTLAARGNTTAARELRESVLETRRRILGAEHPHTLIAMNNLAASLHAQGDLASTRRLLESVLAVTRRILGEDHQNTLKAMNNLARTLLEQGEHAAARALQESALAASRRILGEEHPDTLTSATTLGDTLEAQGDLDGARRLQESALAGRRRVLGETHPHTLGSAWNLFKTLYQLGDHAAAGDLLQRDLLPLLEVDPGTLDPDLKNMRRQVEEFFAFIRRRSEGADTPPKEAIP